MNDVQNLTVDDVETYIGLITSLFEHSPKGAMMDSEILSCTGVPFHLLLLARGIA